MLDRKQIREAISCPQLGDTTYGKWGILTVEQRLTIARLLDELDHADNYIKKLYLENQKQKEVIDKIKDLLTIKKLRCLNENDYILNVLDLDDILDIVEEVSE